MPMITVDAVGDVQPRSSNVQVANESIARFPTVPGPSGRPELVPLVLLAMTCAV